MGNRQSAAPGPNAGGGAAHPPASNSRDSAPAVTRNDSFSGMVAASGVQLPEIVSASPKSDEVASAVAAVPIPVDLVEAVAKAISHPRLLQRWTCLYDSAVDGRSFARLAKIVASANCPTLIVIQEKPDASSYSGSPDEPFPMRYFGGFASTPWKNVAAREKEGKSLAAAKARAARGGPSVSDERPAEQLPQFFGDADCFVFTSGAVNRVAPQATSGTDTSSASSPPGAAVSASAPSAEAAPAQTSAPLVATATLVKENIRVYKSKSTSNANFQYFYDVHPQADRVGLGMGGAKEGSGVGGFAFFLDRYLTKGTCSTRICPTFGNPRLSTDQEFTVGRVWFLALESVDGDDDGDTSGNESDGTKERKRRLGVKKSVLFGHNAEVDKMLLELHGAHTFNDGDYTREGEA